MESDQRVVDVLDGMAGELFGVCRPKRQEVVKSSEVRSLHKSMAARFAGKVGSSPQSPLAVAMQERFAGKPQTSSLVESMRARFER